MNRRELGTTSAVIGFGIDLAGYSGGNSACAEVRSDDGVRAQMRIIHGGAFSRPQHGGSPLDQIVGDEVALLRTMIARGPVAVDIPIDLQGLPGKAEAKRIWELTRRPVDRVLNAMPPLADRIGAPVSRFQNLLRAGELHDAIAVSIFETYPAANLRVLGSSRQALRESWETSDLIDGLTDDEVDAGICAMTAAAGVACTLAGTDLIEALSSRFIRHGIPADPKLLPKGFLLLKTIPFHRVTVSRIDHNQWLGEK